MTRGPDPTARGAGPRPRSGEGPPPTRGYGQGVGWRRAAGPAAVWALMLAILTVVQLQYPRTLPVLLQAGAAAATALLAVGILLVSRVRARRRRLAAPPPRAPIPEREPEVVPDLSPSSIVLAIGLCVLLTGATVGGWLIIGGSGLVALALFGLARELRQQRQLTRVVRRRSARDPTNPPQPNP